MIRWAVIITGLAVILFLLPSQFILPLKEATSRIFARPTAFGTQAAHESRSLIDLVRSIRTLYDVNRDLKAENLRLQAELTGLAEIAHENELLRKELGFTQENRDRYEMMPARLIARSPSSFFQFITVDKGVRDNIVLGQAVVSQGFLIGRVTEVTQSTAKIELITASRSLIPITLSKSRNTGLLKGGLAGLTGEELQKNSPIEAGEEVITSGLGELIPSGIPVGTIEKQLSSDTDIVGRIAIHSPVEFSKLETVLILRPKTL